MFGETTALPDEDVRTPRWLEPLIVREVTSEKAYQDVRLAGRRRRGRQQAPEPASPMAEAASSSSESPVTQPQAAEPGPGAAQ